MAYLRKNEPDEVLVFLNLSNEKTGFTVKDRLINGAFINVFNKEESQLNTGTFIIMQPWDYLVLEKKH